MMDAAVNIAGILVLAFVLLLVWRLRLDQRGKERARDKRAQYRVTYHGRRLG